MLAWCRNLTTLSIGMEKRFSCLNWPKKLCTQNRLALPLSKHVSCSSSNVIIDCSIISLCNRLRPPPVVFVSSFDRDLVKACCVYLMTKLTIRLRSSCRSDGDRESSLNKHFMRRRRQTLEQRFNLSRFVPNSD